MAFFSRRRFLLSGAAIAGTAILQGPRFGSAAHAAGNRVRLNASSAEGKAMLKIYAKAVSRMMARDPGDPTSWQFQWYTHGVMQPGPRPAVEPHKSRALNEIYPNANDPRRGLASKMWDTCTHYGQPEEYFLPWHRLYLYYFEQLVRAAAQDESFTLPYWDYTNAAHRALPPEFLMPGDQTFKSLSRDRRSSNAKSGQPIDGGATNTFLNLGDMTQISYLPDDGLSGFCSTLDGNLHGNVHVSVGIPRTADPGMAFIPSAANDPIFWLHHCNIDRIWASWNKAGGANPSDSSFKGQPFTFAKVDGTEDVKTVGDALDTQQLNYVYDNYLDRPPNSPPFAGVATTTLERTLALHADTPASAGPVLLGAGTTTVPLTTHALPQLELQDSHSARSFSRELEAVLPDRQVFLTLKGIKADGEPGITYDVYLDLPSGPQASGRQQAYVGQVNFFAASHGEHEGHGNGISISLLATDAVRRLRAAGALTNNPTVALVATGDPLPGTKPRIESIALVSR